MLLVTVTDQDVWSVFSKLEAVEETNVWDRRFHFVEKDHTFSWLINESGKLVGIELYLPPESKAHAFLNQFTGGNSRVTISPFARLLFQEHPGNFCSDDSCDCGDYYYLSNNSNSLLIAVPTYQRDSSDFALRDQE